MHMLKDAIHTFTYLLFGMFILQLDFRTHIKRTYT